MKIAAHHCWCCVFHERVDRHSWLAMYIVDDNQDQLLHVTEQLKCDSAIRKCSPDGSRRNHHSPTTVPVAKVDKLVCLNGVR